MKLHIDKIGRDGYDLDEELSVQWLTEALGPKSPFRAEEVGYLRVHLEKAGKTVHVQGRLQVEVSADCSRCLEAAKLALDAPLSVALFPLGEEPTAEPDGELSDDAMGMSTYANDEVDLADVVRDEVFLELPMNPLCSESCAGLCGVCGANRNASVCSCEKPIDPRWSALLQLKKQH